jgi:cytochrome c556
MTKSRRSHRHLFQRAALVTLFASLAGSVVQAQNAPPSKAEQAIKYRQSVYKVILWNFGPVAGMVQGKLPYDAAQFARHAERVATMAPMLLEGYPEGSATGATTRARPEIWANMEEFRELMGNMQDKAAALADVAQGGDLDKSKAAFVELADACKACHDKYRTD